MQMEAIVLPGWPSQRIWAFQLPSRLMRVIAAEIHGFPEFADGVFDRLACFDLEQMKKVWRLRFDQLRSSIKTSRPQFGGLMRPRAKPRARTHHRFG